MAQLSKLLGLRIRELRKSKHLTQAIKELFDFEHFKASKELQEDLILTIKNASPKDLATYYKLITVAKERFS